MAETEYATTTHLPVDTIWDFVQEMDNWAVFVAGYQEHRKESETDSLWTLKGDVGVLTRTLQFRVHVSEWSGPERVTFELAGLNEPMRGAGTFTMSALGEAGAGGAAPGGVELGVRRGFWSRLLERIARFFFRRARGEVRREAPADAGPAITRMHFRLRLEPGGPMAPMVDAMIQPAMVVAAEDLATRIVARVEERHGRRA